MWLSEQKRAFYCVVRKSFLTIYQFFAIAAIVWHLCWSGWAKMEWPNSPRWRGDTHSLISRRLPKSSRHPSHLPKWQLSHRHPHAARGEAGENGDGDVARHFSDFSLRCCGFRLGHGQASHRWVDASDAQTIISQLFDWSNNPNVAKYTEFLERKSCQSHCHACSWPVTDSGQTNGLRILRLCTGGRLWRQLVTNNWKTQLINWKLRQFLLIWKEKTDKKQRIDNNNKTFEIIFIDYE